MIDQQELRARIEHYCEDNNLQLEKILIEIWNAVYIMQGQVKYERPKVYVRPKYTWGRDEITVITDGMFVDPKIYISFDNTSGFQTRTDVKWGHPNYGDKILDESGRPALTLTKDYKRAVALTSFENFKYTHRALKREMIEPKTCKFQFDNAWPPEDVIKHYRAILTEEEQEALYQKAMLIKAEFERLLPAQINLVRNKALGSAKRRRDNKRIADLSTSSFISELAHLGEQTIHGLISEFSKFQTRETENNGWYYRDNPIEYIPFILAMGDRASWVYDIFIKHPGQIVQLFNWVQNARKSGPIEMTVEDVKEALDTIAVRTVIES